MYLGTTEPVIPEPPPLPDTSKYLARPVWIDLTMTIIGSVAGTVASYYFMKWFIQKRRSRRK